MLRCPYFRLHTGGVLLLLASLMPWAVKAQSKAGVLSESRNPIDNSLKSAYFTDGSNYSPADIQQVFSQFLNTDGGTNAMRFSTSSTTKSGVTVQRYVQYMKGIKVEHGTFTATLKDGRLKYISGNCYPFDPALSAVPRISEHAAFSLAKNVVGAEKYMWEIPSAEARLKRMSGKPDTTYLPTGRLVWVEDLYGGAKDHKLHLAYAFDIYAVAPVSRQVVYIDANNGHLLLSNSRIHHTAASNRTKYSGVVSFETAFSGTEYLLYDSTRGNGIYTISADYDTTFASIVDITSPTNNWPVLATDTQAIDAHWGTEVIYDYWLAEHGRRSWDGADGQLLSIVHYNHNVSGVSAPFNNAFWDGSEMVYGDGTGSSSGGFDPLVSLDVAAHEIGHGVCQATADLVYSYESGAMNEGFSDCWAATIENWGNPLESDAVAKQPWKIGEELRRGSPIRSMDNPLLQSDPATYGGTNWINTSIAACPTPTSSNDQCGVHTNSGVLNHWYYFLVNGGSGTNDLGTTYSVSGVGWNDGQAILYLTELTLANTDDYAACRITSINAARTLFGSCSAQEAAVTNAWHAVGVGTAFVSCVPQIGFNVTTINTTEKAGTGSSCPASRTINIPLHAFGSAITGGTPVVTVSAVGGTAVSGTDYTLSGTSLSFSPGDTTTHNATLTLFDNANVNDSKTLVLAFSLSTMGSTATISPTNDTLTIHIDNDDSVPTIGRRVYSTLNTGSAVTSNLSSAFTGSNTRSHSQFLLDVTEMADAGVIPGKPITQIAFNITTKNSTAPFVNYTLSMGNTGAGNLATSFATASTTVFTGNHTTNAGWDSITFSTPFVWDGTSNVVVEVCFGQNSTAFSGNDLMQGIDNSPYVVCDRNSTSSGSGSGCLLGYSSSGRSTARPVMRFLQMVPPTPVETAAGSTATWDIKTGQEVYYYTPSADTNLIAGVDNPTADLGCTSASVTAAGIGFSAAAFVSGNRSRKEVTITPTTGSSAAHDVHFYMTTAELNGVSPAGLYLVRTTAATDGGITTSNTVIQTPTVVAGSTYVDFSSNFTGFGRYFLTDNTFCTAPPTTVTASGATSFCAGGSVTLSAPTGYSYQWQLGGVNIAGATNNTYTATIGGAYTVVVTSGGCSATSGATNVTVTSAYAAIITGATGVCLGSTAMVTDSTSGGTWSTANASIASINSAGVVYGVASGTTTITYTFTNACGTATRTASMTVSAPATVASIAGATSLCPGNTTMLTNTTAGGVWSSSNPAIASISTTGTVYSISTGTANITYSVTNSFGCVAVAATVFTVTAGPVAAISASGSTTFCIGARVTLSAGTGSGLTYQWQVGGVNIAGATTSSYVASASGAYGVLVSNGSCTSAAAPVTVTVTGSLSVVPAVSIAASPGVTICTGTRSVTFTPTAINGGTSPAYQWYVNGSPVSAATTFSYSPAHGDVVACRLRSNEACAFPDTAITALTMTVSPYVMPAVSINAVPSDTVCEGSTGAFASVTSYSGPSPVFMWNKNGSDVYSGPTYYYVPADGDVLICKMRSNYLCRLTDDVQSAPLTVHTVPVTSNSVTISASTTSILVGQLVNFTATATASSVTYQWLINGIAIPGATNAIFSTNTLSNGQVVSCRVVTGDRCAAPTSAASNAITISVSTGVDGIAAGNDQIALEPNPNTGSFTISGLLSSQDNGTASIQVTNMLGQVVYDGIATLQHGRLSETITLGENVANGIYMTTVTNTTTGAKQVFKMVVGK